METVVELKARLRLAEQVEEENQRQTQQELQAEWNWITDHRDNWEWSMNPSTHNDYITGSEVLHGLRILCRVKPEVVDLWMAGHNGKQPPQMRGVGQWEGMFYYRTDEKILTYAGGGSHVLSSVPKLCSDEQWAELCAGRVPDKFRGKWLGGR